MTIRSNSSGTALVAGGAGFLGSFLCERLIAEGWRVICVDNLHTGTLENLNGLSRDSRFSLIEADVTKPLPDLGMRNLLELARTSGARILQTSTSEVYGDPAQHPQTEAYWGNVNPTGIRACYDEGKRAAETLCFDYKRRHGVSVRVARVFNTYGPRMRPDDGRIVSNLVVQAISGKPLTIYGSGEQTRSFCYVSDLIEGLSRLIALDQEIDMPVNLGNPEEFSINELAELVSAMTGSTSEVHYFPLPSDDPRCRRPDISRALALLDWVPVVPVRQGVQATIDWFTGWQDGKVASESSEMIAAD
jgi:UDP-glucuronate decarboxylase